MKIHVSARAGRKNEYIKYLGKATFQIAVSALPIKGASNAAIVNALSEYFNIPKSEIKIIHGEKAKQKVIELPITEEEIEKVEKSKLLQTTLF